MENISLWFVIVLDSVTNLEKSGSEMIWKEEKAADTKLH